MDYFDVDYFEVEEGETQFDIPCEKKQKPKKSNQKVKDVFHDICNPSMDEIASMNYNTWQNAKKNEGKIYICKNGLEELTDKMAKFVGNIKYNQQVTKVEKDFIVVNGKKKKFEHLFVCISLLEAKQFMQVPDVVETIPSFRFYVELKHPRKYPYRYRVSDKLFRWCIVIDERLLLASYLDGERAKRIAEMGEHDATEIILKELEIPKEDVKKTWFMYWAKGFEIVKWDADVYGMEELYPNVFQTFIPDINRNGQEQAWIEAHLLTAWSGFQKISKRI